MDQIKPIEEVFPNLYLLHGNTSLILIEENFSNNEFVFSKLYQLFSDYTVDCIPNRVVNLENILWQKNRIRQPHGDFADVPIDPREGIAVFLRHQRFTHEDHGRHDALTVICDEEVHSEGKILGYVNGGLSLCNRDDVAFEIIQGMGQYLAAPIMEYDIENDFEVNFDSDKTSKHHSIARGRTQTKQDKENQQPQVVVFRSPSTCAGELCPFSFLKYTISTHGNPNCCVRFKKEVEVKKTKDGANVKLYGWVYIESTKPIKRGEELLLSLEDTLEYIQRGTEIEKNRLLKNRYLETLRVHVDPLDSTASKMVTPAQVMHTYQGRHLNIRGTGRISDSSNNSRASNISSISSTPSSPGKSQAKTIRSYTPFTPPSKKMGIIWVATYQHFNEKSKNAMRKKVEPKTKYDRHYIPTNLPIQCFDWYDKLSTHEENRAANYSEKDFVESFNCLEEILTTEWGLEQVFYMPNASCKQVEEKLSKIRLEAVANGYSVNLLLYVQPINISETFRVCFPGDMEFNGVVEQVIFPSCGNDIEEPQQVFVTTIWGSSLGISIPTDKENTISILKTHGFPVGRAGVDYSIQRMHSHFLENLEKSSSPVNYIDLVFQTIQNCAIENTPLIKDFYQRANPCLTLSVSPSRLQKGKKRSQPFMYEKREINQHYHFEEDNPNWDQMPTFIQGLMFDVHHLREGDHWEDEDFYISVKCRICKLLHFLERFGIVDGGRNASNNEVWTTTQLLNRIETMFPILNKKKINAIMFFMTTHGDNISSNFYGNVSILHSSILSDVASKTQHVNEIIFNCCHCNGTHHCNSVRTSGNIKTSRPQEIIVHCDDAVGSFVSLCRPHNQLPYFDAKDSKKKSAITLLSVLREMKPEDRNLEMTGRGILSFAENLTVALGSCKYEYKLYSKAKVSTAMSRVQPVTYASTSLTY